MAARSEHELGFFEGAAIDVGALRLPRERTRPDIAGVLGNRTDDLIAEIRIALGMLGQELAQA